MNTNQLVLACLILSVSQAGFATQNRISSLGSSTAMVADDDTNIDLFPQTINRQNFLRLDTINSGSPNYAFIMGDAGDKWGLYGGTSQRNDFFNIYRSLGEETAIKLGVKIGRNSVEQNENDKEASVTKSSEKNAFMDMAVDATYGKNMGERELAANVFFAYGPHTIDAVIASGGLAGPHGSYDFSNTSGATTTKGDGEGNHFAIGGSVSVRQPMQIALFSKAFANAGFSYESYSSSLSSGTTKLEDYSDSTIRLSGSILLFEEKNITDSSRLFYGLGSRAIVSLMSGEDKATSEKTKDNTLMITAPQIRLGIESDIKYGKLRFGIYRDIDLLNYNSSSETPNNGANNDDNSDKTFDLISDGSYFFGAGYGMQYKNLKIDITISNAFWIRGPQMIFDTQAGALGGSADVIYTF